MNFKNLIIGFGLFVCFGIFIVACTPETLKPEGLASFSVTNVAPGSPVTDVLVDGRVTSASRLSYGSTTVSVPGASTIYLPIMAGDRNIKISTDTGKLNNLIDVAGNFEVGKSYTYVVLDTVLNGKLKTVRLVDNLSIPAAGTAKFRVIHAAPTTGAVDVTLLRTSAATPDSVTISNLTYLGNISAPDIAAISNFTAAPSGSYTIKVKQAGTQTIVVQATTTLTAGRIYSFFVRGGAKSQALGISSAINY